MEQAIPSTAPNQVTSTVPSPKIPSRSILPLLLMITGLLVTLFTAPLLLIVLQLSSVYSELQVKSFNPMVPYSVVGSILLCGMISVVYGGILFKMQKTNALSHLQRTIAIILFVLVLIGLVVSIPSTIMLIITPIYHLTSSF